MGTGTGKWARRVVEKAVDVVDTTHIADDSSPGRAGNGKNSSLLRCLLGTFPCRLQYGRQITASYLTSIMWLKHLGEGK